VLSFADVALRRGPKLLFENVTFQVHTGQRLGLIGANGSGKSSLFAAILGELEADQGDITRPDMARIAWVAQQSPSGPGTALDFVLDGDAELRSLQKAMEQAERAPQDQRNHDLFERFEQIEGFAAEARAARLLDGLGFSEDDTRRPVDEFSGGWRMRLALARALMCRSDLLLLDEPTNHLDLPAILWLEGWLRRYSGVLLLISHDRDFLDALCNRIGHIEHGAIRMYTGNYSDFERLRAERLAQQESLHQRQQTEIRHIQTYIDRFRYKASKARQAQSRLKMLERMTLIAPAHVDSPFDFEFLEPPRQPQHLARLESVDAGYSSPVLRQVNLQVRAGDRIGLLGVNGAGKSTLVKALADGSTVLAGERMLSRDTRIGYFAQHQLDQLDPDLSPLEQLRLQAPGDREAELRRYLGSFGFSGDRVFEAITPFSGGEKARLVLALLIRKQPNLLLLDEPTNHLDLEMRQALGRALVQYGGALVLISHDRHLLRSVCDELVVVHDGEVEQFDRSLDDYPDWLNERATATASHRGPLLDAAGPAPANRRQLRQEQARLRLRLKPLSDEVRKLEERMSDCRAELTEVARALSDPDLYAKASRKDEVGTLTRLQAELRSRLESLESQWLEAAESLERAQAEA